MVRTFTLALACLCISVTTNAQEGGGLLGGAPAKEADGEQRVRRVVALRHMPATDLTKTLAMILRGDDELDVVLVPEMISNSLLLAGPDEDVKKTLALIDQLDRAPKMIRVSVTIAEVKAKGGVINSGGPAADVLKKVKELEAEGKVGVMNRISLTTIDNQSAYVQLGQQKPTITGRTRTSFGATTNSVSTIAVGTIVKATPRVNGDRSVVMKLDIEKSWVAADDKVDLGGGDGDPVPASITFTASSQSTITVPDGKVVVVSTTGSSTNAETKQLLFFVSTDILAAGE